MIASKLVLRAREAIDNGQLDDAERALRDAGALDPQSTDLAASLQALENARAAAGEQLAEAERQAEAEPVAQADSLAADPERRETGSLAAPYAQAASNSDRAHADEGRSTETSDADTPRKLSASLAAEPKAPAESADQRAEPTEFVAISTLQRTNYVAPRYPRTAQRRGVTGWVDISFTVLPDGTVSGIGVMDSEPGGIFDQAATEAVAEWRFEPPVEEGMPVERRVAVRMMFNLQ
jgi:protein TonB